MKRQTTGEWQKLSSRVPLQIVMAGQSLDVIKGS